MLVLFFREIIILLQKMHQKLLTQLKNRARQNRARQKFCRENRANRARFLSCTKSCTISVVISNPGSSISRASLIRRCLGTVRFHDMILHYLGRWTLKIRFKNVSKSVVHWKFHPSRMRNCVQNGITSFSFQLILLMKSKWILHAPRKVFN